MNASKIFRWLPVLLLFTIGILVYLFVAGCKFLGLFILGVGCCYAGILLLCNLRKHNRKVGTVMLWCFCVLLILSSLAATITGIYVGTSEKGDPDTSCKYMILLGAGVNGKSPSLSLRDRIQAAYDYMVANPEVICIASGGQGPGEDITEAQCIFQELSAMGIDPGRVWLEERSTSTQENIRFSLDLIRQRTGEEPATIGVLSSEYHLCRAKLIARGMDLSPVGIPAKTSWPHLHVSYFLREIFVIWAYAITGRF